jgi:serine acetyltransferase
MLHFILILTIIWELNIGNNVVIGAHVLITKDILDNTVITITNNIN